MKLSENIINWAGRIGIFAKSTPLKQLEKSQEELTEFRDEVTRLVLLREMGYSSKVTEEKAKMELGDLIVTLRIVAEMMETNLEECEGMAFEKIDGRSGKMVRGVFVKDADLETDSLDENGAVITKGVLK